MNHFATTSVLSKLKQSITHTGALALLCAAPFSSAFATSLDLSNYTLTGTYNLPAITASEASAVTYNWDTNSLFIVGDEGEYLVEVDLIGNQLSAMSLSGFGDTEGVTYLGGGEFVITEERLRDAFKLSYSASSTANRSDLLSVDLGASVGNVGIEGISYDPRDGSFITVKERLPQEVNQHMIDFDAGTSSTNSLFDPSSMPVIDVSDVQVLATAPSLIGTEDENNLLIISQESAQLLEVNRNGDILSRFDFSGISDSAEGVTIGADGTIYIVDENGSSPRLFTLAPQVVPVPAAAWLFSSAILGLVGLRRRQQ